MQARHWCLLLASFVGLLFITTAVFSPAVALKPLFAATEARASDATLMDARKSIGDVISREEDHLLAVLGLQMAIVAFAATMIFGKDFTIESPRELFGILILLTLILALVYIHLYKGYLGAYAYAVRIESSLPGGLRVYQQVYASLAEHQAPLLLRPFVSLTNTFYAVSFLPIYVVMICSVGFGRKLGVSSSFVWAINILAVTWAFAYLLPVFRLIELVGG